MKITKDTTISVGALILLIPAFLWLSNKADKEDVAYEHDVNIQQTTILDNIIKEQNEHKEEIKDLDKEIDRIYRERTE